MGKDIFDNLDALRYQPEDPPNRRKFTRKEKNILGIIQDVDPDGMHADHIEPYSKGGKTDITNARLITPEANRTKSDNYFELRKWQSEFINVWNDREESKPFLLVCIPGGGKTYAALHVATQWMDAGADRRIIIVVPSRNLQGQWKREALERFGIELETKEFGTNFKHGFNGAVVCYPTIYSQQLLFKKLCHNLPVMVILDEPHHCGENATWGIGIKEAFIYSKEKLLLSGTPWRTCGTEIPYVKYNENGFSKPNYFYDYPNALNDEVVRYLTFNHIKGSLYDIGTDERYKINKDITDEEASARLHHLLKQDDEYCTKILHRAHNKLMQLRKSIPDAGALAACVDIWHAGKIASVLTKITGEEPSVIVSDEANTNDTVEGFKKSSKKWIVAVRQICEGTDIKRLQVLCYLTNIATELFFRQLIGRVSRVRGIEDFEAYVFLPSDPRLVRYASNIEKMQIEALRIPGQPIGPGIERGPKAIRFYKTSEDGIDLVLIGNEKYEPDHAKKIEYFAEKHNISNEKMASILSDPEFSKNSFETKEQVDQDFKQPKEDRMDQLRKECNRFAFRLSKLLNVHVKEIHKRYKPQQAMTEPELEAKRKDLQLQIQKVSYPI